MAETRRLTDLRSGMLARAIFPASPYVVALSGGADSAALASLALSRSDEVEAIHIHHGLDASDALEDAARQIAATLDIELSVVRISVPPGPSPEAKARQGRYEAIGDSVSIDRSVLTAHTRDDHAETVLLNLIRGTGLRGLTGIPFHRAPNCYRPLLGVSRTETREYATLARLPFFDDPTNRDRSVRRNWVRLELIPKLQEINPSVVDTLTQTADNMADDAEILDLHGTGPRWEAEGSVVRIAIGDLSASPNSLRRRVLQGAVAELRPDLGLSADEVRRLVEVSEGRVRAAEIEGGIRAEREGPFLTIRVHE